ncbi:insertion element ISR1 10 kDa protein A3 [Novosphingobium sp. Rr 2-17]|nr:insertion element ISR1 10 kDa protein A3 [Novosphingobium sp. Rr 2-17]
MSPPWGQLGNVLQVEVEVWRPGGVEARRLRALEDENAKLKKRLAEAILDNVVLKDLASKKW